MPCSYLRDLESRNNQALSLFPSPSPETLHQSSPTRGPEGSPVASNRVFSTRSDDLAQYGIPDENSDAGEISQVLYFQGLRGPC